MQFDGDSDVAKDVVEVGELEFRPVLEILPTETGSSSSGTDGGNPEGVAVLRGLEDPEVRYRVGPAALTGEAVETARAAFDDQVTEWAVNPVFKTPPRCSQSRCGRAPSQSGSA